MDIVKKFHVEFNKEDPDQNIFPESSDIISQYLFLFSLEDKHELLNYFISPNYAKVRINATCLVPGTKLAKDMMEQITGFLKDKETQGFKSKVVGTQYFFIILLDYIIEGLLKSFTSAFLLIFVIMAVYFRSVKIGLFALIPNIFPVVLVMGTMGFLRINLDVGTSMIASIIIGIAVDDTIHFISRFQKEWEAHGDYQKALDTTLQSVGRPVICTTLVLTFGFWVLLFSNYLPILYFGFLSGLAIFGALIADIVILPAFLLALKPYKND